MIEFGNVRIYTDNIDPTALAQLHELVATGVFGDAPIRIMPDCHAGAGCVIGFTAPLRDKVIPNIVGVDLNCGMLAVDLGQIELDCARLDAAVRERVPCGREVGRRRQEAVELLTELRCNKFLTDRTRLESSLGTLGGGNHFIEVDRAADGSAWLIVHSGSRNLGKQVAEFYQKRAVNACRGFDPTAIIARFKAEGRQSEIERALAEARAARPKLPEALCWLEGDALDDYLHDARVCGKYAALNRGIMADNILSAMGWRARDRFTTLHNYVGEDGVIRKGAIGAHAGERVLIPLNMRDGCVLGTGLGNADWNNSAPHGAGRAMSRSEAKRRISLEAFRASMEGIFTTTADASTIDESPFAYKPSDEIVGLIGDTVRIDAMLKPVYNFKAAE